MHIQKVQDVFEKLKKSKAHIELTGSFSFC